MRRGAGEDGGLFLGLNSGTSADRIDACLVHLSSSRHPFGARTRAWVTLRLPSGLRAQILAGPDRLEARSLTRLDAALGDLFGRAAAAAIRRAGVSPARVRAAGLHGQTICHLPARRGLSATMQIASPERVARRSRVGVVSAFRQADVAAGGEGAPLSPALDHALFGDVGGALVLNLGGIANLTAVPETGRRAGVLGFDVGPGNMLLDAIVRMLTRGRLDYDPDGAFALRGRISPPLLEAALDHPFLRGSARRSTGREEFGEGFLGTMLAQARRLRLSAVDLLATASALTAEAAWRGLRRRAGAERYGSTLWVAGGGVHNRAVMRELSLRFGPDGYRVRPLHRRGVTPENRECVLFALLAREFLAGRPANFPSATGARDTVRLGRWTPSP